MGLGGVVAFFTALEIDRAIPTSMAASPSHVRFNADAQAEVEFKQKVQPFFNQYCYECHGDGVNTANLELDSYKTAASAMKDAARWELVERYVHSHEMPPPEKDREQPSDQQREEIAGWVDGQLNRYYQQHPDPGRVTIHRLNRAEYNNTIRDLVGVDFRPADEFPVDDSGYGFDNVGDVLSVPPMLAEKYMTAAKAVMDQAIVTDPIVSQVKRVPASLAEIGFNSFGDRGDGWVKLVSLEEDDVAVELSVLAPGDYKVRVMAYSTPEGGVAAYDPKVATAFHLGTEDDFKKAIAPGPMRLSILLNDAFIQDFPVTTDEKNPGVYEARFGVPAGKQRFRASVRRIRGGANELLMKNGRLGKEQGGVVFVKYMEIEGPLQCSTRRYPAADLKPEPDGALGVDIDAPTDGQYFLRGQAYAMQAGDEPARMEFRLDGKPVRTFDVLADGKMQPLPNQRVFSLALLAPAPQVYEFPAQLTAGHHHFSARFINPFSDPTNANPNLRVRSLTIQNLEVAREGGDISTPEMPRPIRDLFDRYYNPADSAADQRVAAQSILSDFGRRAWRRPLAPAELTKVMKLFDLAHDQGDGFNACVKLAMEGLLISPHFLYRGELQAEPDNQTSVHAIDEYALASRLSYFLWSSTPDDELLDLASRGQLRDHLQSQINRMLTSPKSQALVDNFGGQWLQFRGLETAQPDATIFTSYDAQLRLSMQAETRKFFEYVLREDRSVMDFLDGDYTFVNRRLADLYGIKGVEGDDFQKVSLEGLPRRGVLTQASVLTLTSNPNRTSPVKRGKWVLENILGTPPPPPPPTVPPLEKEGQTNAGTLRHQMEQHRADPACASCHARMDPLGFALENFDGIGAWRDTDGDSPIEPAGTLMTGESFNNCQEMLAVLAKSRQEDFIHCLSEKMLTYALGRGVEVYDHPALDQIVAGVKAGDFKFSSLIEQVVMSPPFQNRRGEGRQN